MLRLDRLKGCAALDAGDLPLATVFVDGLRALDTIGEQAALVDELKQLFPQRAFRRHCVDVKHGFEVVEPGPGSLVHDWKWGLVALAGAALLWMLTAWMEPIIKSG